MTTTDLEQLPGTDGSRASQRNPAKAADLKKLILPIIITLYALRADAGQREAWYQDVWCTGMGGKAEHRLEDGRRIDCLTDTHAIEVEFSHKWPEAVGQSLDYSMLTGKKAGIVLIVSKGESLENWQRLNKLVEHYQLPIRLWKLGP